MNTPHLSIADIYKQISDDHSLFLSKHGVVLPNENTKQALSLIFLYIHREKLVSLSDLRKFVIHNSSQKGSEDIQPRHLKYAGWHVLLSGKASDILYQDMTYIDSKGETKSVYKGDKVPSGYIVLCDTRSPSPDFELKKRRGNIDKSSWESMLNSYDNKCAVCHESKLKLEKGHKDPAKGFDLDNIIPMCSDCNNWASNDYIFDEKGRIIALASPKLVLKSDLAVKIKIFFELKKDKSVNP